MTEDLFKPSLSETEQQDISTYEIDRFYLVGFFGGLIPLVWMAGKNAARLGVEKKTLRMLCIIGILGFSLKYVAIFMMTAKVIAIKSSIIKLAYRVFSLGLAALYIRQMKAPYNEYTSFGGSTKKILGDFIEVLLLAMVIEAILAGCILYLGGIYAG